MVEGKLRSWRPAGAVLLGAIAVLAAGCGSTKTVTVTTPGAAANTAAGGPSGTPHVFEGSVKKGESRNISLDCSPGYLEAGDENRGTISDSLRVDTAGTDGEVTYRGPFIIKSTEWGHIGSRLGQAAHVDAYIAKKPYSGPDKHYKFTLYCVKDQSAAWVIFG